MFIYDFEMMGAYERIYMRALACFRVGIREVYVTG